MIEELWKKYNVNKNLDDREALIMACLPYIKSSAYRLSIYANPSQDVNDLVSAGIIGLMDAVDRYDPAKGASFKNYSRYRVRGSIMDEVRSMDWVPYSTRDKARKIEKAYAEFRQNGDEPPNDEDIARVMGISLDKYHETLLEVSRMTLSLLEDAFCDGDIPNNFEGAGARDPQEKLVYAETEYALGKAIDNLPEKERLVVSLYYYEEMTMKEIGQVLDISESRVCQIHSSAILRLHTRLKHVAADISV
jgi:RNA polymerase sigma factor for flagellar operon FliA